MKKIPITDMQRHTVMTYKSANKVPLILVLDNIRSMHNVGAAFRVADAFMIEKLYLCGITATPPRNEISKTALGAEEHVEWEYHKSAVEIVTKLKMDGCKIVAVEQIYNSVDLSNFEIEDSQKYVLVFGNEVSGVSDEVLSICDLSCEIGQYGVKHSLNISVALGIVAWRFTSTMKKNKKIEKQGKTQ